MTGRPQRRQSWLWRRRAARRGGPGAGEIRAPATVWTTRGGSVDASRSPVQGGRDERAQEVAAPEGALRRGVAQGARGG